MKKSKKNKSSKYNLLMYVEKSSPKIKRFESLEEMGKFVEKFQKKHPDHMSTNADNWVDYAVTDITGEVYFFTDGLEVQ